MEKKPQDTESRHADKYIVRFPNGMRDQLAEAAKANARSMNSEVVSRLQYSFERPISEYVANHLLAQGEKDATRKELTALREVVKLQRLNISQLADRLVALINQLPATYRESPEAKKAASFAMDVDADLALILHESGEVQLARLPPREARSITVSVRGKPHTVVLPGRESVDEAPIRFVMVGHLGHLTGDDETMVAAKKPAKKRAPK